MTLSFANAAGGGYNINLRVKRIGQNDFYDGKPYRRVGGSCGTLSALSAASRASADAPQIVIVNPDAPVAVPAAP